MMRAVLKAYGAEDRCIWVADSFCGLPEPNPQIAADAGDMHHTFPELVISQDQVEANFAKYGLLDDQVRFLKGWFSETLPSAPIEKLVVLRLEGGHVRVHNGCTHEPL
jgi:Macrocin-O-methyltransferase (TylF)